MQHFFNIKELYLFFIAIGYTHPSFYFFFIRVANSMVEYSAFKCDSIFYTFLWTNWFIHTIGRVCKTTTDPERNEWKKQHVVSMANSKNISFLFDPAQNFCLNSWLGTKKIQLGWINKGIELGGSNYRETKSNELSFFIRMITPSNCTLKRY